METRLTLHFVDAQSRNRAEMARTTFELGHHAEVYDTIDELLAATLEEGIVMIHYEAGERSVARAIEDLAEAGVWLPVIAYSETAQPSRIVAAIKAGALEYLSLPLSARRLRTVLTLIGEELREAAVARRRMIEARGLIATLSNREREVLDWLTAGHSNKSIARSLDISPRTVEIHRANMMAKLGAGHPADAVRMRLQSRMPSVIDEGALVNAP